jgi:Multicopper oxidase
VVRLFSAAAPSPASQSPLTINVINDAGYPDIVHWHGLYLPAVQDGATEDGMLGHDEPIRVRAGERVLFRLETENKLAGEDSPRGSAHVGYGSFASILRCP